MKGENILKQQKEFFPIILTFFLFLSAFFVFFFINGRIFQNISLWIPISLYFLIDIGFVIASIFGIRSPNSTVKMFSILSNIALMIPLSIWLYLLLLANGLSEP